MGFFVGFIVFKLNNNRQIKGFSLIELVIAMVVVGILFSIAVPQYNMYFCQSRRAQAENLITSITTVMIKYYSANKTYSDASLGTSGTLNDYGLLKIPTLSDGVTIGEEGQRYTLSMVTADDDKYCIQAQASTVICGDSSQTVIMRLDSDDGRVRYCKCGSSSSACQSEAESYYQ